MKYILSLCCLKDSICFRGFCFVDKVPQRPDSNEHLCNYKETFTRVVNYSACKVYCDCYNHDHTDQESQEGASPIDYLVSSQKERYINIFKRPKCPRTPTRYYILKCCRL